MQDMERIEKRTREIQEPDGRVEVHEELAIPITSLLRKPSSSCTSECVV